MMFETFKICMLWTKPVTPEFDQVTSANVLKGTSSSLSQLGSKVEEPIPNLLKFCRGTQFGFVLSKAQIIEEGADILTCLPPVWA